MTDRFDNPEDQEAKPDQSPEAQAAAAAGAAVEKMRRETAADGVTTQSQDLLMAPRPMPGPRRWEADGKHYSQLGDNWIALSIPGGTRIDSKRSEERSFTQIDTPLWRFYVDLDKQEIRITNVSDRTKATYVDLAKSEIRTVNTADKSVVSTEPLTGQFKRDFADKQIAETLREFAGSLMSRGDVFSGVAKSTFEFKADRSIEVKTPNNWTVRVYADGKIETISPHKPSQVVVDFGGNPGSDLASLPVPKKQLE